MLTYTFITFPRNAYCSFTENSLVYSNVLRACLLASLVIGGIFRLSCSPLINVVCIPVLARPKGIIPESLISQLSQLFTKNQDLFWLCNDSDHLKW